MKRFKNFITEGYMSTEDFKFETRLNNREIYFTNRDEKYDDYDDLICVVYWHIDFDWMGDDGIDYYIRVDKVALEFTAVIFGDDEDIREEKTLLIDDPDKIEVEITQTEGGGYSRQLMPQEVSIDGENVEVLF